MVDPKFAMLQKIGSHPLQRAATEHSREPLSSDSKADYAPAQSVSTHGRTMDRNIRLHKSETVGAVCIKTHHPRTPDVGIGILVAMPCYRAGEIIEYYGEYLGHGQSKTAFELNHPGARFHGQVLKVAKADDMEPSVFL